MSLTLREAVIHPITPTITVGVVGANYPAVPSLGFTGWVPFWPGHFMNASSVYTGNSNLLCSNQPTLYATAFSTGGDQLDYVGVKMYALSGGLDAWTGGERTDIVDLAQPENKTVFGAGVVYSNDMMCASLASTLETPEALAFVKNGVTDYWGGWKLKAGVEPNLIGLWGPVAADANSSGTSIWAAIGSAGNYYILRNGSAVDYVLTICPEGAFPASGGTHYSLGFDDPDLPATLDELLDVSAASNYPSLVEYYPVSCLATSLGFLITYKRQVATVWTHHYILVDLEWANFQWVEFIGDNALADDVIAQSDDSFFTDGSLNLTSPVSANYSQGHWYLLGGTLAAPIVASDFVEDYAIVNIGVTTPNGDQGFFDDGPFGHYEVKALIDGAFFGYVDLPFPLGTETPDDCSDLLVVAQPAAPPTPSAGSFCVPFAIGKTFTSKGQILRPATPQESQTQSGPAMGKLRRMTSAALLLSDTQGVSMGVDFLTMRPLALKSPGGTVSLTLQETFSGVYWGTVDATDNYDNMWCWQVTRPYPATVVAVECQLETKENL